MTPELESTEELADRIHRLRNRRRSTRSPRTVDPFRTFQQGLTPGDRMADAVAANIGSWRFIGTQSAILVAWIVLNVIGWIHHWDPYPFILLNLALSFQAAYAAPIIMMSQNRMSDLDRVQARSDFEINQKAEQEVEEILSVLEAHTRLLEEIRGRVVPQHP